MDFLGSIFENLFADGAIGEGVAEVAGGLLETGDRDRDGANGEAPVVYARYLCGGPRPLGINDR